LRLSGFRHGVITDGLLSFGGLQVLNLSFEFRDPFEHRPNGRRIYLIGFGGWLALCLSACTECRRKKKEDYDC
jgi:hypothetical protein